ncbi:glycoside hydrolase family 18 chitinase [Rhizohabitans arisaemae]|uniref:glycoside hydrolase family 18 chitinase n=1 Tax=Rhizohabitans arisaemae TaxID=2720610 RepID=UPI0024B252A2|nr:glycoside hydrolase family 18 chitinase [Rhizohabitans arisaemae]
MTAISTLILALFAPISANAAAATATFTKTGDWGTGWQGSITINNGSSAPLTSWKVEFDLAAGTQINSAWDARMTRTGQHWVFDNLSWNGTVPVGGRVSFGFLGSGNGANAVPVACKLNGAPCGGDGTPPSVPTGLTSPVQTFTSVDLRWNASTDDSGTIKEYRVYEGTAVVKTVTSGTSTTITGLAPTSTHTYTVTAVDPSDNESAKSAPVTVTTGGGNDTVPPTVPGNLRVTGVTGTSIALAWNPSTDNSGVVRDYRVYEGTTPVKTVTSGTSTVITGLANNSSHTYTVSATDHANNESAKSGPVTGTTTGPDPIQRVKVGYFVQWGIYGRGYTMKSLDTTGAAAKLTHINYAFSNIHPTQHTCMNGVNRATTPNPQDPNQGDNAGDAWADYTKPFGAGESVDGVGDVWDQKLAGNFNQLKKLKAKHPHLKSLISLGGWTYSKYFSDAASTPAKRAAFVKSCIDMYIKGDLPISDGRGGPGVAAGVFDGIDIDWEWPGAEGHAGNHISPNDKANLTALLALFRSELDALSAQTGKTYLLTAFTPADPVKIDAGWDISQIFNYLDFANVQGYDFHGAGSDNSWEPNRAGHQGNLFIDSDSPYNPDFSVEKAINHYLDRGVNPRKLSFGIAFYGRGWQQVQAGAAGRNGEWQTANGAAPGDFPVEAGTRSYKTLFQRVPGCTVYHDVQSVSSYCFTGNNGQWWTFDDAWSIQRKAEWAKSKNLLGLMVWEMSGDDGELMTAIDTGLR